MSDVVAQVLYQVGVWVISDDDLGSAIDGTDKTGQSGAGAKLEYRVVLDELACTLFEII